MRGVLPSRRQAEPLARAAIRTPRSRGLAATLALVLGTGALLASSSSGDERARRVLLVGLDGADWRAIEPLVAEGVLPTFSRLLAHGRTGVLLATPPLVSPIIWTTIATGRRPEDHRILDFMIDVPGGGQAPVPSSERRVAALWNIFSDAGRTVDVIGWWATWPAEDVKGTIVSDRVAPQLARSGVALDARAISPPAAATLARSFVHATDLRLDELSAYVPLSSAQQQAARAVLLGSGSALYRDPIAHLATVVASTRTYGRIAEALLASGQPELMLVYLEEIDSLSHRFVKDARRGPPAIRQAYRDADRLLAKLVARVAPDTWVFVVSDHGFYADDAAISEDPAELAGPATAWHRPYGIVAAAEARQLAPDARAGAGRIDVGSVTPLDIAPTLLHAAGLPVSREMPGRVVGLLTPDEARAKPIARVDSFERPHPRPAAPVADPDARERLQALGYLGAGASSLAQLNLGEIRYRRGDFAGAERELREVVAEQPTNVPALLWLAKAVREQGRAASALDIYARVLALPGDNGDALVAAVELAASTQQPARARRMLEIAREPVRPKPASAVARAIVARMDGRLAAAERELRAALVVDPTYLPALERLFELSVAAGRARDAVAPLRLAAGRAAGSPRHQALLGLALLAAGDAAEAELSLTRALRLAPDGASVRLELARAQLAQGKLDAALGALEAAPPSPERSILIGAARSKKGQWAEAAAAYDAALAQETPTPALLNGLAWARLQTGRRTDAEALLVRSLGLDPNQPEIRRLLDDVRGREK
jgi:Tfp pilus assembly protein PilF